MDEILQAEIKAINIAVSNAKSGLRGLTARVLWDALILRELYGPQTFSIPTSTSPDSAS